MSPAAHWPVTFPPTLISTRLVALSLVREPAPGASRLLVLHFRPPAQLVNEYAIRDAVIGGRLDVAFWSWPAAAAAAVCSKGTTHKRHDTFPGAHNLNPRAPAAALDCWSKRQLRGEGGRVILAETNGQR